MKIQTGNEIQSLLQLFELRIGFPVTIPKGKMSHGGMGENPIKEKGSGMGQVYYFFNQCLNLLPFCIIVYIEIRIILTPDNRALGEK